MNVPRIDQITVSVDIAHLHVSGFILHAGARDRQHSEMGDRRSRGAGNLGGGRQPVDGAVGAAHAGEIPTAEAS